MINDNLAPVLIAGSAQDPTQNAPLELRQGTVESWDPATGEGVVRIAGGSLANLNVLTSESVNLAVGDVISLLSFGDRSLILGKTTTPGDPDTVPTWAADITVLQTDVVTAQTTADTAQTTATTASADAATAVSTATSAAADATAALDKFPITSTDIQDGSISTPKLAADAIDGITITGSLFRTAASGQRVEIDSPAAANQIQFFTTSELNGQGSIEVGGDETNGFLVVTSPQVPGGDVSDISMGSVSGASYINLDATSIAISGDTEIDLTTPSLQYNGKAVVTATDTQTLTNKILASPVITETEIWHDVGNATTGLGTTFAAGAADAAYPPSFRKDSNGVVHIRGVVTTGVTALTTIFTLPAGYRPTKNPGLAFICYCNPAGVIGRVVVSSTGAVQVQRLISSTTPTAYQIDCSFSIR